MFEDLALSAQEQVLPRITPETKHLGRLLRQQIEEMIDKDSPNFATINELDSPPAASQFFHHTYPKVSPDFDNQHHTTPTIFFNHFYLGRWLPAQIQKIMFPWEDLSHRKLTCSNIPTTLECHTCLKKKGHQQWNSQGEWFCLKARRNDLFDSYEDYLNWKRDKLTQILDIEEEILRNDDPAVLNELFERLAVVKSKTNSQFVSSDEIYSIND